MAEKMDDSNKSMFSSISIISDKCDFIVKEKMRKYWSDSILYGIAY